ncbi:heme-dependent oxidative N-demethylase family protein [Mastigocoleus testarum]|uniref:DUF3445 domain-containing protein n=1 Tax=Mastigocoleus testarum BC008 TaxID=371196 RepID=A0A0V7ZIF2_9CYAN|nr:DUF3445 domain-containing protein [Mastigocoleus testarum]KST64285.1 hypothetical protein BC008_16745 [Mastigocoleus testarum BC008]
MVSDLLLEAETVEKSKIPVWYFPLANGRYEVKPGMIPLGSDLGNGKIDEQVFQIDSNFAHYRRLKLAARKENLDKYYQTYNYPLGVATAVAGLIIDRLTQEYPQYFTQFLYDGNIIFKSFLTGESLYLDKNLQLQAVEFNSKKIVPVYTSTLDALAAQTQEDITVICRDRSGKNWVSAIHLCFPNHWSAEEKIGKDFTTVHAPVAGMEKMNRQADKIVNTIITRRPMVRFAWGLSTDTRLNHHPRTPQNISVEKWNGRKFNRDCPRLYLRIERQTMWGLPEHNASLFTIRTYFRDCSLLKKDNNLRYKLSSAIESMTSDSLIYKGLTNSKEDILNFLNNDFMSI